MNSTENLSKNKRVLIQHSAEEKCRAVLSVWSERRKVSEVSKELQIGPNLLSQWQERAMEAMLRALESKSQSRAAVPALAPKLQKLLLKRVLKQEGKAAKLRQRLEKLQQPSKPPAAKPS